MRVEDLTTGRGRRVSLVVFGFLTSFGPIAVDLYLPAFPSVAGDLNISLSVVALTLTTALLGLGVGQVLYGPLSDRFGRKGPLLTGLLIFTIASVGCALAPNFASLLVLRFFQSLGGSAGIVIARAMVRDLYHGKALARALSIVVMVFALAPVLSPSVGALLLQWGNWRLLFVMCGVYGLACLAVVAKFPETLVEERRSTGRPSQIAATYLSLLRDRRFLPPALLASSTHLVLFAYISSAPAVMMDYFEVDEVTFALIFGALALCFAAGASLNSRLLKSFEIPPLLVVFVAVQLVAAILVLVDVSLEPSLLVVAVGVGMAMMTVGVIIANATALCLENFPMSAATAAGLLGVFGLMLGASVTTVLAALHLPVVLELGAAMLCGALAGAALLGPVVKGKDHQSAIESESDTSVT